MCKCTQTKVKWNGSYEYDKFGIRKFIVKYIHDGKKMGLLMGRVWRVIEELIDDEIVVSDQGKDVGICICIHQKCEKTTYLSILQNSFNFLLIFNYTFVVRVD